MNKSRAEQIQRGEWLEHFLNPFVRVEDCESDTGTVSGFRTLAIDALGILGITEEFDLDNDPGLLVRAAILAAPDDIQKEYKPRPKWNWYKQIFVDGTDPLKLRAEVLEKIPGVKSTFNSFHKVSSGEYRSRIIDSQESIILDIPIQQNVLKVFFKKIAESGKPWDQTKLIIEMWTPQGMADNWWLHKIMSSYGRFSDKMFLDDETGHISFGRVFDHLAPFPLFPWTVVCSTILFDFLRNGGQDQYSFCKHCGRFTFSRKGEKSFCSDKHRYDFHNRNKIESGYMAEYQRWGRANNPDIYLKK